MMLSEMKLAPYGFTLGGRHQNTSEKNEETVLVFSAFSPFMGYMVPACTGPFHIHRSHFPNQFYSVKRVERECERLGVRGEGADIYY